MEVAPQPKTKTDAVGVIHFTKHQIFIPVHSAIPIVMSKNPTWQPKSTA